MPSENPTNLIRRSFFNRITSCFHPSDHTQQPTIHGGTRAAPPVSVDKSFQSQYREEYSLAPVKEAITSGDSECCSICLPEFTGGASHVKVLPGCGHVFHEECINAWLPSRSLNCPVCRDQAVEGKLIGKPVGDGVLLDPAAALALNFSSHAMYMRCSVVT